MEYVFSSNVLFDHLKNHKLKYMPNGDVEVLDW